LEEAGTWAIQKSVAIITGASQGIGRVTALRLARDFSAVVLVARDMDNLEKTAVEVRSLGAETMVLALDLRQPQSAKTVVKGTLERFGRIDVLLNIAGAVAQIDLFQMTDVQWDDGMALKFHGARRSTIEAWDALKASNSCIYVGKRSLRSQAGFCGGRGDQCSH
jgi:3-oxoacyl-[acyl-carrier protein] reductase